MAARTPSVTPRNKTAQATESNAGAFWRARHSCLSMQADKNVCPTGSLLKSKIFRRIVVTNVAHRSADEFHVARKQAAFDFAAENVAEHAPEILVARVGKKRAR